MAHKDQLAFLRNVNQFVTLKPSLEILEFGSYDVNGHIRDIFFKGAGVTHHGIDLIAGPNVTIVADASTYKHPKTVDLAISCECFEHNPYWRETLRNMISSLKDDGCALLTFASYGRSEHGTTRTDPSKSPGTSASGWDYYQNIGATEIESELRKFASSDQFLLFLNLRHFDVYVVLFGAKSEIDKQAVVDAIARSFPIRANARRSRYYIIEHESFYRRIKARARYYAERHLGGTAFQFLLLTYSRYTK